ncbi:hypothetical protein GCM10023156_00870 [Novipirellula rosea]|uniref:Uncharacterized protein n=1 Tax=Novipirellula rosea TaxID=1031540 RepID=A0ABP8M353_9BACT
MLRWDSNDPPSPWAAANPSHKPTLKPKTVHREPPILATKITATQASAWQTNSDSKNQTGGH